MTLRPALARFERGFRRMGGWAVRVVQRRPRSSEGQIDQERETRVSLGLMASAETAQGELTPEQQIFLSQSAHGMRERLSVLLMIPHRSLAQEREKLAIDGWLARAAGAANAPTAPRRFLPALPAIAGFALRPWMLWAGALLMALTWGLYSDIRAGRAELARDEAESLARTNYERAEAWQRTANEYRQAVIDAANVARMAADALDAERAAQARAAARERRRNRDIQDVLTGSPEPPAWRLRDDGAEDRDSGTPTG